MIYVTYVTQIDLTKWGGGGLGMTMSGAHEQEEESERQILRIRGVFCPLDVACMPRARFNSLCDTLYYI